MKVDYQLKVVEGFPVPRKFSGITIGKYIFIKAGHEQNPALLQHEIIHVKQFQNDPFLFWLKYLFSSKHRFRYEAEAFAASVRNGMDLQTAAYLLASNYSLDIELYRAEDKIKAYLRNYSPNA